LSNTLQGVVEATLAKDIAAVDGQYRGCRLCAVAGATSRSPASRRGLEVSMEYPAWPRGLADGHMTQQN